MKPMPRLSILLSPFIAALSLSCDTQQASGPRPAISFDRSAREGDANANCLGGTRNGRTPVALLCAITVPGNPILSGTKSWVDPETERYYLTDVSNAGVDIIEAERNTYVGRVSGFVGATGVAATSGPNSIVFTGHDRAWVSDGNSNVRVVDLHSGQIIASVSTAIPACDGGTATTHFCQRTNEITYDPEDRMIFVQNPSPLAVAAPHGAIDTYGTFISAVPPYAVVGTITFTDARGQEAPLWDAGLHRIVTAVSGRLSGTTVIPQYVAVINPKVRPFTIEHKYVLDCSALVGTAPGALFGINDPALGPQQHVVIPACGHAVIMNAQTGAVITVLRQIGGGNETWYNRGDNRFYVTGVDSTQTPPVNALGVIDARTSTFLQGVPAVQATNPAALAGRNRIFAVVQVTAAQVTTPASDTSACAQFGVKGRGCILVFAHVGQGDHDEDEGDRDE
jgi:hypothetical protein